MKFMTAVATASALLMAGSAVSGGPSLSVFDNGLADDADSKEGVIFRAMIRRMALPNVDSTGGTMIMVTSFNEWYEDSQVEGMAGTEEPSKTDDSDSGDYYTGGQSYVDYACLYLDDL